jgi:hypothetical protein
MFMGKMMNTFLREAEPNGVSFMPQNNKENRNRITFDLDDDLVEPFESACEAYGRAHGTKTKLVNDALRAELPKMAAKMLKRMEAWQKKQRAA